MKPFYALVALAVIAFVPVAGAATPGKRCLFLHGVGQAGPKTGVLRVGPLGSFEPYFGDLASALSDVCGTVETVEVTTTGLAWSDAALQKTYYERAKEVSASGGVVFAHSMANNVLAGACYAQGLCEVRWYGLGGPLRGSKAAHATGVAGKLFPGVIPDSLAPEAAGIAPSIKGSLSSVVYEKKLLRGAACGTSAWGSGGLNGAMMSLVTASTWGVAKGLLGKLIAGWSSVAADGLVHLDECSKAGLVAADGTVTLVPLGDFAKEPTAAFYSFDGNHYDLTGTAGNHDGIIDWIRARVVAK